METPKEALEYIAEQIEDGYTSGRIDNQDGSITTWTIGYNTFK